MRWAISQASGSNLIAPYFEEDLMQTQATFPIAVATAVESGAR
jgi:hypothetical protein